MMAIISYVASNGSDTAFHINGAGFGGTQATYSGKVYNTNTGGARSLATITSWNNTDIYGTLSSDHAASGKLSVVVSVPDHNNVYHPVSSNMADYAIS
jgi:hypothetical protein